MNYIIMAESSVLMYKGNYTFYFYRKDRIGKHSQPKLYSKRKAEKYIKYVYNNNVLLFKSVYYLMTEEQFWKNIL